MIDKINDVSVEDFSDILFSHNESGMLVIIVGFLFSDIWNYKLLF